MFNHNHKELDQRKAKKRLLKSIMKYVIAKNEEALKISKDLEKEGEKCYIYGGK